MSVDFRQRSAGEFFQMLKRRKWLILLPVLTMTMAIGYVVYKLPSVYESKTVLTVKDPTISSKVVADLTDVDISQRIETINTRVLSRTSLEPMIAKYKLFELERNARVPIELIVDRMRRNIAVELVKTDRDKIASFEISYRDRTPEAAKNVAAELASKYVSTQVIESTRRINDTKEFIENELAAKKKTLDELSQQRLGIMMQNVDTLPESAQGLIAQLEGLRKSEENLGRDIQALDAEKSRLNQSISGINREIRIVEDLGQKQVKEEIEKSTRIEDTSAYGTLLSRKTQLNAQLKNLKLQYKDKHPKVIEMRNNISEVDEAIAKMRQDRVKSINQASKSSDLKADIQKQRYENEKRRLEAQIAQVDQNISLKRGQIQQNAAQISVLEAKINTIPNVRVLLESVEAQYQSAKKTYDDLEKKRNDASLQVNRESSAQGETISVIDPANLPKSPVAPKRELLTAFGGGLGLAIGLFLAAIFEVPRLFKIQNIEDAKHYTGLPLLASVPPLLTQNEIAWNTRAYWLKVLAGATAALGIIPIIIMILQASRILERFVS